MFKEAMYWEMEAIRQTNEKEHIDVPDETYAEWWEEMNHHYHWFLNRMEQWLNGSDGSTPMGQDLYNRCIDAHRIGKRTGYYWNKISKKLVLEMKPEFEKWRKSINGNEMKWISFKTMEMKMKEQRDAEMKWQMRLEMKNGNENPF